MVVHRILYRDPISSLSVVTVLYLHKKKMDVLFPILFLLCLSLSFPSLYLAYKIASKRTLGSIFNQNIFFLFVLTGLWNY